MIEHTYKYMKSTSDGLITVTKTEKLGRKKAVHLHCLDCSGGNDKERRLCVIKTCPLFPYRYDKASSDGRTGI